jgi:hypothetical protein
MHATRLTVFNTGGLFAVFGPVLAEIAQICRKWKIVNRHSIQILQEMFGDHNTKLPGGIPVFLLTGHLTGMATGAIIIFDKQSVLRHQTPILLY